MRYFIQKYRRNIGLGALVLSAAVLGALVTWLIVWLTLGPFPLRVDPVEPPVAETTAQTEKEPSNETTAVDNGSGQETVPAQPTDETEVPAITQPDLDIPTDRRIAAIASHTLPSIVGIRVAATLPGGLNSVSEGSGVIYSSDGYILTNNHVIAAMYGADGTQIDGSGIQVYLYEQPAPMEAWVIGRDASTDLALLKIDAENLPAARFGNSDLLEIGETAVAIGSPSGLQLMGSVTSGIISGLDRPVQMEDGTAMKLIQTDAAVNTGNSGGALINEHGLVIGMNNAGLAKSQYEGINFAIPANTLVRMAEELKRRPDGRGAAWLGVSVIPDEDYRELAQMYDWPERGVYIYEVQPDSPAALSGLEDGDIIVGFDQSSVVDSTDLSNQLSRMRAGQRVRVRIYRTSLQVEQTIEVILGERLVD